jgi:hypothetical protein
MGCRIFCLPMWLSPAMSASGPRARSVTLPHLGRPFPRGAGGLFLSQDIGKALPAARPFAHFPTGRRSRLR